MKQLIAAILDIWSRTVRTGDEEEEESKQRAEEQDAVKIAAFLWIRHVMLIGDRALKENILKVTLSANQRSIICTDGEVCIRRIRQEQSNNQHPNPPTH